MLRSFTAVCILLSLAACSNHQPAAIGPTASLPPIGQAGVNPFDQYARQIIEIYRIRSHGRVDAGALALGVDGDVYFTEGLSADIGKVTADDAIIEYPIPSGAIAGEITPGDSGYLWFAETKGVGRIDTGGSIVEFPMPAGESATGIILGPDHNIWYTDTSTNSIGTLDQSGHFIAEYALPTAGAQPQEIAVGSDGNLWFTEMSANKIGRSTPKGSIKEFSIPIANAQPFGIAQSSDGKIYATSYGTPNLIQVTRKGVVTAIPCCGGLSYGRSIIQGMKHKLWVSLDDGGNTIGQITRYDTSTGITSPPLPIPKNTLVGGMVNGSDGDVWFSGRFGYVGGYIGVWEESSRVIGIRLNGEMSIIDPNYGFELGYARGFGTLTQTVGLQAGETIQFQNLDSVQHTAAFLGDATAQSAPWPSSFNGGTSQSPANTVISTPNFSTGTLNPGKRSLRYEIGPPGFYMIGCQYHYNSSEMRTVLIVQ